MWVSTGNAGTPKAWDMTTLEGLSGAAFDQMWLQMMVEHHEGAVTMAEQVAATTLDPDVATLAEDVIKAQNTEIVTMKDQQQ